MIAKLNSISLGKGILIITLFTALFFGFRLGSYPLLTPDEARYSEIPREMLASGDFITPHLNGIKYLEKPPLFYWLQTIGLSLFGINEFGARFANFLLGILGCILIYVAGYKWFSPRTGIWAAIILAVNAMYFGLIHAVTLDLALTLFITMTLLAFYAAQQSAGFKRRLWCYAGYTAAALAVLTKGLVGILLPSLIIFCWMLIRLDFSGLRNLYWFSGIVLFCLIAIPWHYLEQQINPEFFNYYFIEHHFKRYATDYAQRVQPWWYFLIVFLLGTLPWSCFFINFFKKATLKNFWSMLRYSPVESFLFCWLFIPIIFFSLSHSKLIPYILPSIPAFALLMAKWVTQLDETSKIRRRVSVAASLGAVVLLCATWIPNYVYDKTVKPFIPMMKQSLEQGALLLTYEHFFYDLPFYTQRIIPFAWVGGELSHGIKHSNSGHIMLAEERFFKVLDTTKKPVWILLNNEAFSNFERGVKVPFEVKATTSRNMLLLVHPQTH